MSTAPYALFPKEHRLTVTDGTPIAYTLRGRGPGVPIVLVNGWSCSDAYWAEVLPYFEGRGHRVVLPDTRGHGESGLPRRPGFQAHRITAADMALERIADDLIELCAHQEIGPAVFIGHSLGVQVILEVYRRAPERVAGLVAVAGAYENPLRTFYGEPYADWLFPVGRFAMAAIPDLALPALRLLGDNARLGHRAALLVRAAGPKTTAHRLAPYISHLVTRDPRILFKLAESMRDHSAADLLPTLAAPMLIAAAGHDTFTPPRVQKRMHELAAGSEIVWFDDASHCLPIEEPAALNAAIADFLDRRVEATKPAAQRA